MKSLSFLNLPIQVSFVYNMAFIEPRLLSQGETIACDRQQQRGDEIEVPVKLCNTNATKEIITYDTFSDLQNKGVKA